MKAKTMIRRLMKSDPERAREALAKVSTFRWNEDVRITENNGVLEYSVR